LQCDHIEALKLNQEATKNSIQQVALLTEQNSGLKDQVSDLESQLKKSKAELKEAELETGSYKRLVA
jgi:hypothetical protein